MPRISKDLENFKTLFNDIGVVNENIIELMDIDAKFIYDLNENVSYIVDERIDGYVIHSLESVVLSVIFATLANCNTFVEIHLFMKRHFDWLNKHIKFDNGLPSISTLKRVMAFINPKELENICLQSLKAFLKNNYNIYRNKHFKVNDIKSMDGKVALSSERYSSKDGAIAKMNAMSLYSLKNDVCEATEFIEEKSNEIPAGINLLKKVNIKDCVIVFDAMSTQRKTIDYIVENKGFYVAPVKKNQGMLEEDIRLYFEDKELLEKVKKKGHLTIEEKAHGTYEKREYIFTNDIDWLCNKNKWSGLKSIGVAIRTYQNSKGETIEDRRYFITNIYYEYIDLISNCIRGEWGVENKVHWYLDAVFKEDKNTSF